MLFLVPETSISPKIRQKYIDSSGHFVLIVNDIFCSSNFYNSSFQLLKKLDVAAIYKSIVLIFLVNLPLVFIYNFIRKKFKSDKQ